jgi:hypothetical protein
LAVVVGAVVLAAVVAVVIFVIVAPTVALQKKNFQWNIALSKM